ncbi:MAG TPA: hypothetical protein VMW80_01045 [Candidatus Dormibacteraeota bacterium]|nr:hypothetical protein [Candidatus Dormibacteraeota bacterium]
MVNEPRRRRSTALAPTPIDRSLPARSPSPEWRIRLALGLLFVSACSVLFNVIAVLALGGAIANLGAPQGPLDFALVFIGAVVGLGGDAMILAGTLGVLRPGTRFTGHPERVSWGLGLQLLASALVGVLESSWTFAVVYVLLLGGLAYLWIRTSPTGPTRPAARHPVAEAPVLAEPAPVSERFPIPWVGNAPPPPSSPGTRWGEDPSSESGPSSGSGARRGPGF